MGITLINDYNIGDWFIWAGQVKAGRRVYVERYRYLETGTRAHIEKSYATHQKR
jgi:hypothetical protein